MKITGFIQTKPRVRTSGGECYGSCYVDKRSFRINIANAAFDDPEEFADTTLHELLHLWFALVGARFGKDLSERKQHKVIDVVVPKIKRTVVNKLQRRKR